MDRENKERKICVLNDKPETGLCVKTGIKGNKYASDVGMNSHTSVFMEAAWGENNIDSKITRHRAMECE